jgi:hypothetical protein
MPEARPLQVVDPLAFVQDVSSQCLKFLIRLEILLELESSGVVLLLEEVDPLAEGVQMDRHRDTEVERQGEVAEEEIHLHRQRNELSEPSRGEGGQHQLHVVGCQLRVGGSGGRLVARGRGVEGQVGWVRGEERVGVVQLQSQEGVESVLVNQREDHEGHTGVSTREQEGGFSVRREGLSNRSVVPLVVSRGEHSLEVYRRLSG